VVHQAFKHLASCELTYSPLGEEFTPFDTDLSKMASSWWDSTQRKYWTFTKAELDEIRTRLDESEAALIAKYPLPDRRLLNIYFSIRKTTATSCRTSY
jgi:hypothetical protein